MKLNLLMELLLYYYYYKLKYNNYIHAVSYSMNNCLIEYSYHSQLNDLRITTIKLRTKIKCTSAINFWKTTQTP